MHILLTRAEPFISETAECLVRMGHSVTKAPLLDVTYYPLPCSVDTLHACDALVVTSYQALCVPGISAWCRLPLWCVGRIHRFTQAGWRHVQSFSNVRQLLASMPRTRRWLYVRGARITQRIVMPHMVEHIGYRVTDARVWPVLFDWATLDGVMLMSRHTALNFMRLSSPDRVRPLTALCHSAAVANVVRHWPWKGITVGGLSSF